MIHNSATPKLEVEPKTYEVRADAELLTCEPARDASKIAGRRPFVFTNLRNGTGLAEVVFWLTEHLNACERGELIEAHVRYRGHAHSHQR